MENNYTTGQLAKLAGVSERTIRYYDQQGLLKPSFLMENGYRCYRDEDVVTLQKIISLKYLGFSLVEIKTMLQEERPIAWQQSLDMQIDMIDQKIQHMNILKESLVSAKEMLEKDEMNWEQFTKLVDMNDQDEKIIEHYRSAKHLAIRIQLHEMFSTNPKGWFPWLIENIDFQHMYRMLEIGCGNGTLWENCKVDLRNRELFLSDISEGMVEAARQRLGEDYSYMCFDCQRIPFKKEYFDGVIANHMLFYVNDMGAALKEIYRVLRKGGVLYCSTYGSLHMKEITALVQGFDARATLSDQALFERFGLDHGKDFLTEYFEEVSCLHYEDSLEITEVQPLFEYIMSCHGNQKEILSPRLEEFMNYLQEVLDKNGAIHVTKDAGLCICKK